MLGKVLLFLALLALAGMILVLYCCLVVASREDQRLEEYGMVADSKDSRRQSGAE